MPGKNTSSFVLYQFWPVGSTYVAAAAVCSPLPYAVVPVNANEVRIPFNLVKALFGMMVTSEP